MTIDGCTVVTINQSSVEIVSLDVGLRLERLRVKTTESEAKGKLQKNPRDSAVNMGRCEMMFRCSARRCRSDATPPMRPDCAVPAAHAVVGCDRFSLVGFISSRGLGTHLMQVPSNDPTVCCSAPVGNLCDVQLTGTFSVYEVNYRVLILVLRSLELLSALTFRIRAFLDEEITQGEDESTAFV